MSPPPLEAPPQPRSPWQLFYNTVHRARRRWWRSRAGRLPRPVVSVGNLHWGGTGKTPLVAAVARHLADGGRRVAVLSRGYGRHGTGIHVVSAGAGPLLGPRVAGDEPVALAAELPGVAIVVGSDRYRAGLHALERIPDGIDCFVLDDGFSHLRLERDLDILVFPASDPFGGGRLAPSGRLREPLSSARRASAVVLAGLDSTDTAGVAQAGKALAHALNGYGYRGPGFASRTVELEPLTERRRPLPPESSVFLVTGIANPARFRESVEKFAVAIVGALEFDDHHDYGAADLAAIEAAALQTGAEWVLTTTKDYVKLLRRLQVPLAHLPIRAEPEAAFWRWLDDKLRRLE